MEPSVILCKGYTIWQGFLITASLLTFWHLSTTARMTTESVPPLVAEGDNVLIHNYHQPKNVAAFVWFKGFKNEKQVIAMHVLHKNLSGSGPVKNGRGKIYPNGSLLLEKVTQRDTGFYTLRRYNAQKEIISTTAMYLHVSAVHWKCGRHAASDQLTIESVPPSVAEGGNVLLRVHNPPENIIYFAWYEGMSVFNDEEIARYIIDQKSCVTGPAYSGREMLYRDGSLLLHGITQKDPGLYTLRILTTDMRNEEAHVQLWVDTPHYLCCNPFTSSQLMIKPVPQYATEGKNILLQVHNLPEDMHEFTWYKTKHWSKVLKIVKYRTNINFFIWEPEHKDKGMVYKNGSLMLLNVTEKDAGMYVLTVLNRDFQEEEAYVEIPFKKYVTQPLVQITNTRVTAGTSVILTCISPDTDISIHWIFNNRSLHLTQRMTLSSTKCGLKIEPVSKRDSGEYKCEVSNQLSMKTSPPVNLEVINK